MSTRDRRRRPIAIAGLRGFDAAARHLSFTLAAKEMNLTQSSISRQVAALERQVGKPLFERRTRALELTPAGEALLRATRRALVEIDRTVTQIRGVETAPRVHVATYASFASLWLVPRLPDFQRAHPGVEIRIDAADRVVDIESEDVDMAIRWLRPAAPLPANTELVFEEEANAAVSPRLLESLGRPLRKPEQLNELPLLALDESVWNAADASWDRWCEHAGIAPLEGTGHLYFTYIDQSVQAAVRGQGAVIARTPFLDDFVASGDLVVPFPALKMATGCRYAVVINRQRAQLPHVQAFRDWVIAGFRSRPPRRT
jgi:DNA-binding transcriptional LysR family regulator